jgi:hypothetical protein
MSGITRGGLGGIGLCVVAVLAGCPAQDSARTVVDPVPIVAGEYTGTTSCTTAIGGNAGGAPNPFSQPTRGTMTLSISADGTLIVAGSKIEPGAVVTGATDAVSATQTITAMTIGVERIVVEYESVIEFEADGEKLGFAGRGSYEIIGVSETQVLYVEDSSIEVSQGLNFQSSLRCEGTLSR